MAAHTQPGWTYVRPPMYPKQHDAMFVPRRYSVTEATTKSGKSVSAMVWITEQALQAARPGRNYWWVAPIYSQAKIIFDRLRRRLPAGLFAANQTNLTIHILPTDATIWFKSAEKPDSLYGEDVWACVLDEASRMREEAFFAVRSTLTATKGPLRLIGNVKGRRNFFYRLARRAERGDDPDLGYHKITAYDAVAAGVLDQKEIEDARSMLPEAVFKELYEAEASDDEGNPFGLAAIDACAVGWLSEHPVVCWGIDLARKHDYTVGIGLDRFGSVAEFFRFQKPWDEQIAFIREKVGALPTLVDATGLGDVVLGLLQSPVLRTGREGALLREEGELTGEVDDSAPEPLDSLLEGMFNESKVVPPQLQRLFSAANIEGYLFNPKSKQSLMEGLAVALQHQNVRFPRYVDIRQTTEHPIKLELEAFEYVATRLGVRYAAPEGEYDDCVCALGLAVQCLNTRVIPMQIDFDLGELVAGFQQASTWSVGEKRPRPDERGYGEISLGW